MNRLRKLLIVFCMLLFCNTLYAIEYEASYDGSHTMSQYATNKKNILYADNKIFYIYDSHIDSRIMYEDTNTGSLHTIDMLPTSTISSANYTFYQMYECTGGYIILLRKRNIQGWSDDFIIKRVSKDFKTTYFEYRNYDAHIHYFGSDSVGNVYMGIETDDDDLYVFKFSPSGQVIWKSYVEYYVDIKYSYLDSNENLMLYVGLSNNVREYYFDKNSGKKTSVSQITTAWATDTIFELNSDYFVYTENSIYNRSYYVDRKTGIERLIDTGTESRFDKKFFRLSDNTKVVIKYNNSYLTIFQYDQYYNLIRSYGYDMSSFISGGSFLQRIGVIADNNQIYLYPSKSTGINSVFIYRIVLSKAPPTVNSSSLYEYIGDSTNGVLNVNYDLKENTGYSMKVYNVNNPAVSYYSGAPIPSLSLNIGEGDHYFQVMLTNGIKSVISNTVHINKKNLLSRAYSVVSKGKEQYVILDDTNRYYENNTANQQLVSKLKNSLNGVFVISNDASPVLVPLLEK